MKAFSLVTSSRALVFAVGCGGGPGDMPEVGTVTGQLTLDGAPISGANISFYPLSGGRSASAVSDDQGMYTLQYNATTPGAKVGENEVTISTLSEPLLDDNGKKIDPGRPEEIPAKYASEKLKVTVEPGENTINLTLTST